MRARQDLPPIARRLNTQILNGHRDALDAETAAAISELSSQLLNAVAELENDLIINRARSDQDH